MYPVLRRLGTAFVLLAAATGLTACRHPRLDASADAELLRLNRAAMAAHEHRCLNDASRNYAAVLRREPPVPLTDAQWRLILDLAPRLHTTEAEPFLLVDVVALVHPTKPWIAYHLFWDDDIDFPEDNDPTDHEIVWVRYDPATGRAASVATYFHGSLLRAPVTADRPDIGVEWGKHGSLPLTDGRPSPLPGGLQRHWQTLSAKGIRLPDHPHARDWPKRFDGDWDAYLAFRRDVEPRDSLQRKRLAWVSRWSNATLNQYALRYNFAAKSEWPE